MHPIKLVILGKITQKTILVRCQEVKACVNESSQGKILNKAITRGNRLG